MANYPTNPAIGDTFVQGNVEYKWNGIAWDVNGTTGFDILADYAKKVGDNAQVFKVADAVNADEAMALGQLTKANIDPLLIDADTVDGVQGALLGIGGAGYSWVDETANRVSGTTYTNTTGRPIMVNIKYQSSGGAFQPYLTIDGINVYGGGSNGNNGEYHIVTAIIPGTSTYMFNEDTATISTNGWTELK